MSLLAIGHHGALDNLSHEFDAPLYIPAPNAASQPPESDPAAHPHIQLGQHHPQPPHNTSSHRLARSRWPRLVRSAHQIHPCLHSRHTPCRFTKRLALSRHAEPLAFHSQRKRHRPRRNIGARHGQRRRLDPVGRKRLVRRLAQSRLLATQVNFQALGV